MDSCFEQAGFDVFCAPIADFRKHHVFPQQARVMDRTAFWYDFFKYLKLFQNEQAGTMVTELRNHQQNTAVLDLFYVRRLFDA